MSIANIKNSGLCFVLCVCVFPRARGQNLVFAEFYDGTVRLMSDLLWPTAAAAGCPALHVPAHPCSLCVYACVCLRAGDR